MAEDELPEDLAPREKPWWLGSDFIGTTVVLIACVATIVTLGTLNGWGQPW